MEPFYFLKIFKMLINNNGKRVKRRHRVYSKYKNPCRYWSINLATVIGMWFTLQADIAEAKELPLPPRPRNYKNGV